MPEIKKAIIKSYDTADHKATVQIAGSLGVWLDSIRVATDIPAADVAAGRQCTVLFLDPSNQDDALVLSIQGALPSGGGGTSDHGGLTGLGDDDHTHYGHLSQAETWSALQTFSAGIRLAASQQIQDSGGTGRYLPATSSPHNTLTGDTRIDGHTAINSAPKTSPRTEINIAPTLSSQPSWTGIDIAPQGSAYGNLIGVRGSAQFNAPASSSSNIYGLAFLATLAPQGAAANANDFTACRATPGIIAIGSPKSSTITTFSGFVTDFTNLIVLAGATATLSAAYGLYVIGRDMSPVTCPNLYGIRVEDFTNVTGNNYLLEIGPQTPYLRLLGGGNPGANQTNLYLLEQNTLRRVQWKDGASVGAGDRVMVLV